MANMKRAGNLLGTILDLGEQLLASGAEVWRVEEILENLFDAYCFKRSSLWISSTGIMATVYTWDDRVYTQVRGLHGRANDLDKLERLYRLVNEVCETPTGVDVIRAKLDEIIERPSLSNREKYIASAFGAAGFAVLYSGGPVDAVIAAVNALLLVYLSIKVTYAVRNLLARNIIASFLIEIVVLAAMCLGITSQPAPATISAIFLLISGLGLANGISELMHGNPLSGLNETAVATLGALGIAVGITLAMLPFQNVLDESHLWESPNVVSNPLIYILACTAGCTGFAMLMGTRKMALLLSAVGAALTQSINLFLTLHLGCNYFIATLQCACVVAVYALIVSRAAGIHSAVFRISCVLPLLPGSNLYFTVFGAITSDFELFRSQGLKMILVAVAIAFGYITVDVIVRLFKLVTIRRTGRR